MNVILLGERLAYRSFNGANKALPVLASCLNHAGFRNVRQMDLELNERINIAAVTRAVLEADLLLVAGAMTPQWSDLDKTLTEIHGTLTSVGRVIPIIVGGYAAKNAKDVLEAQPAITALFDGEGEAGVVEVVEALASGTLSQRKKSIRGMCYIDESGRFHRSVAARVTMFDHVDQNFELIHDPSTHNMEIFARPNTLLKTAQVFTQRGCPWICGFCNKSMENGKVVRLSADALREQLRALHREGFTSVWRRLPFLMKKALFGGQTRASTA
jgi:anaerobic magnesium-protoporphyrin IX monomethyl ester cyclase